MTADDRSLASEDLQVLVQYRLVEALQEREHLLAEAQRLAHMGSWSWDVATGEAVWSDELYRILGLTPGGPTPGIDDLFRLVRPDHRARCEALVSRLLAEGGREAFEVPLVLEDGRERWLEVRAEADDGGTGRVKRLHGVVHDITAARAAETKPGGVDGLFQALVENTSDVLTILDTDGTIRYSSPSLNAILGYTRGSLQGAQVIDLVHHDDAAAAGDALEAVRRSAPGESTTAQVRVAHADGSWRIFEIVGRNLLHDEAVAGLLLTSRDITDRKQVEHRLEHEMRYDQLTGVANRRLLTELVGAAIERGREGGWTTALAAVDIDGFGAVNDAHGLGGGDRVLVEVAQRLERAFRASGGGDGPAGIIGRLGGDTFVVVVEQAEPEAVVASGDRIVALFARPFDAGGAEMTLTASVGIAVADAAEDRDFAGLLHDAEAALRAAKSEGGGACRSYDPAFRTAESKRSEAVAELEHALHAGELRLFFQPKISLVNGKIIGSEALMRWQHPERGLVPPLDFIPLAEESGLVVPMGAWVIEEACRAAAGWRDAFPEHPPLVTAVNVSPKQFGPALVETVERALAAVGLAPEHLGLEVTESLLMDDVPMARATLRALKEMGVLLSIDDFGTGYSSLAYLKDFDLHELKIDQSFVAGLGTDPNDSSIVAAVIALSHALELGVVAEGVETAEQAERLRSLGCEVAQGYHFARPAPAEAFTALLEAEAVASWRGQHDTDADAEAARAGRFRADRVLVVDDSPEIRQLALMSLTAVGFEVHEAEDGAVAVEMAKRVGADCIVLDVSMPGVGGLEACRALRADPATAGCTIVMLTANAEAADKVEAFSAGADDYLVKPFSPRDLASRIRAAMQRRSDDAAAGAARTSASG